MAEPTNADEFFDQLTTRILANEIRTLKMCELSEFIDKYIENAAAKYPFLKGKSGIDHCLKNQMPMPTTQEFWDAVYDFEPLFDDKAAGTRGRSPQLKFSRILAQSRVSQVPMGTLVKESLKLALQPYRGALPATPIPDSCTMNLEYAITDSVAVSYPDGHPSSELHEFDTSTDDKLRRCCPLGYVMKQLSNGVWRSTGHVLVMDMQKGRDRAPWMILSSEWHKDPKDETDPDEFYVRPPELVPWNASTEEGVLPGNKNRTSICEILSTEALTTENPDKRPVLRQFGPNFEIALGRWGGARAPRSQKHGPSLVHVMDWFKDPATGLDVCFGKNGKIYMTYDRTKDKLNFPNLKDIDMLEEYGWEGQLEQEATL